MSTQRTHKLQLDSVTLNFRLWDGPPSIEVHDPPRYHETPEYTCGRYFATVEVHRLGVWIRTLNEKADHGLGIARSLTPRELRQVVDDITAAVARVQRAGFLDEDPNAAYHAAEAELEAEEDE
jgi:hypothetical protein